MSYDLITYIAVLGLFGLGSILIWERGKSHRQRALAACLVVIGLVEICYLAAISSPDRHLAWQKWAMLSEGALPIVFFIYAWVFVESESDKKFKLLATCSCMASLALIGIATVSEPAALFFNPDFATERILFLNETSFYYYILQSILIIIPLLSVERIYAALPNPVRWQIKYEVLGVGVILAAQILFMSQAILYRSIDMQYVPVRALAASLGVIMIGFSTMRRGQAERIYVSKDVAFKSVIGFGIGLYLIFLGLLGEGMRYFGDPALKVVAWFAAVFVAVGFLLVVFSETFRRKLKVFLNKNFYRNKYDYRKEWMEFTRCLAGSRSRDELFEAVLGFYCDSFAMEGAALFLPDGDGGGYRCVARREMDEMDQSIAVDGELVRFVAEKDWVVSIKQDGSPIWNENRELYGEHNITNVIPLKMNDRVEGLILLGSKINKSEIFGYEDYDLMKMLARQATAVTVSLKLAGELAVAREMEAVSKVSAFVMHDLKNLVSNLSLVVENSKDYMDDPDFQQDLVATVSRTVSKMTGIISRLQNLGEKRVLDLSRCDLEEVAQSVSNIVATDRLTISGGRILVVGDSDELQKVLINLVLNGLEASKVDDEVRVTIGSDGRWGTLTVEDSGDGMSEEFIRTNLFKPFSSTKKKGFGIGLYQCKHIVDGHNGHIEVESTPGEGTVFTVQLPLT